MHRLPAASTPNPNILVVAIPSGPSNLAPASVSMTSQKIHANLRQPVRSRRQHARHAKLAERLDTPRPGLHRDAQTRSFRMARLHRRMSSTPTEAFSIRISFRPKGGQHLPVDAAIGIQSCSRWTIRSRRSRQSRDADRAWGRWRDACETSDRHGPYRIRTVCRRRSDQAEPFNAYFGGQYGDRLSENRRTTSRGSSCAKARRTAVVTTSRRTSFTSSKKVTGFNGRVAGRRLPAWGSTCGSVLKDVRVDRR